jgi:hypothetical protein
MSPISVPSGQSISDLVLILDLVENPARTKKALKELKSLVDEYQELSAKASLDLASVHKYKEEALAITGKHEKERVELTVMREQASVEKHNLSKLSNELKLKEIELFNKESSLNNLKLSLLEQFKKKEEALASETIEAQKMKEEAQKIVEEYNQKLIKIKAVVG